MQVHNNQPLRKVALGVDCIGSRVFLPAFPLQLLYDFNLQSARKSKGRSRNPNIRHKNPSSQKQRQIQMKQIQHVNRMLDFDSPQRALWQIGPQIRGMMRLMDFRPPKGASGEDERSEKRTKMKIKSSRIGMTFMTRRGQILMKSTRTVMRGYWS